MAAADPRPALRIGLFGLFGNGNFGNDASLEAMLGMLRRIAPDARLLCICAGPETVGRAFGVPAEPIGVPAGGSRSMAFPPLRKVHAFARALRICRELDVLLFPGTGILDDFGEGPFGVPSLVLGWCLAARRAGTRIGFVGVGAGPIRNPLTRPLILAAAWLADWRSYRDRISRQTMARLGLDVRRDPVHPDLAFALPLPPEAPREAAGLSVGVGVMAYYGWKNKTLTGSMLHAAYRAKMTDFVCRLLDKGHRVRILIGETTDRETAEAIVRTVLQRRPLAVGALTLPPLGGFADVLAEIAATDIVVATRYHNVIAGLLAGRPTLSLGYAAKNAALLAEAGLNGFAQDIEALDVDRLVAQFDALAADRDRLAARVGAARDSFRESLRFQELALTASLLAPRAGAAPGPVEPASPADRRAPLEPADGARAATREDRP